MKKHIFIAAGAALGLLFTGCEQKPFDFQEDSGELTMAEEEIAYYKSSESTDQDVSAARFGGHTLALGMAISGPHLFFGEGFPDCATVTVDESETETGFPKTLTVDYSDGCSGRMGRGRTGTIVLVMSDTILNEGAVYTVTFNDVTVGNRNIEKTAVITNEGMNDGNWILSETSESRTLFETGSETYTIIREFAFQKEWLAGFDTPEAADDQFLKTGGGTITVNGALSFEKQIYPEDPLWIDRSCTFPLSGTVEITRNGETMTIDYGTGECDNIALVTKDGEVEEIELNSGKFGENFRRQNKGMKRQKGWW